MSPEPVATVEPMDLGGPEPATGQCSVRSDTAPPTPHDAADAAPKAKAEGEIHCAKQPAPFSPPDSNKAPKSDPAESELSDLGDDVPEADMPDAAPADDIGDIYPDHWSGGVPVFKPTMREFQDFKVFVRNPAYPFGRSGRSALTSIMQMEKVDWYGMRSGIIKIIPPDEWKNARPEIDDMVKRIRVRDPIKQEIMGSSGTYRQVNFVHGRAYTLRQWKELCEQSEHQPPARRGERRLNSDRPKAPRPKAPPKSQSTTATSGKKRGRGRPPKKCKQETAQEEVSAEDRPMTPVSDKQETGEDDPSDRKARQSESDPADGDLETAMRSIEAEEDTGPNRRTVGAKKDKAKTQSTSARRKFSRREGSVMVDEEHFKDFDYRMDVSEFTPERCEELERIYWKTLTYAPPLYGADLMGTLFDDRTEIWNLNKLPNLLDVLGTKVPGVNTAYLYLGMWKATFAWHLEDVDLYSINYLHFGAPKQWYSISQADAKRFEAAMRSIWPTEGKACDQFLRHKSFLISPSRLLNDFGVKVNKCVSYPGEFVVTYPYGYHSGYNLGYNCAEAVNFALDSWLPMGKIAKKCECALAQDSVWIDVHEIERKLRGEETDYEEWEDEEEDEEVSALPTPPDTTSPNGKSSTRKRKRASEKEPKQKKVRIRAKVKEEPPCCLCPNDIPGAEILPTEDGGKAHRMCALYLPETFVEAVDGSDVVMNVSSISKERKELRCLYCRSKRGACFQCSQKTCARAYHATCAAAAGVFVEEAEVPVFDDDGTEYKEQAFEFSCRFHRTKRDRRLDGDQLEADEDIRKAAKGIKEGEICQFQYLKGDIFAGVVAENRVDEEMFLVDIMPKGYVNPKKDDVLVNVLTSYSERIELEWKWLLLPDPNDYHLPKASANAKPLPSSRKAKKELNAKRAEDEAPRTGAEFVAGYTWAEFTSCETKNSEQAKVDLSKEDKLWFYLGETSTDAKAHYTDDVSKRQHNPKSNFLDTVPKPPRPSKYAPSKFDSQKPYVYKPRVPGYGPSTLGAPTLGTDSLFTRYYTNQAFAPRGSPVGSQAPQHARSMVEAVQQSQSGQAGQSHYQIYQQYQAYQNAQGYQHFRNYQAGPSRTQSQQPQAAVNRQSTSAAGGSQQDQAHRAAWPAGYNPGYNNAYRDGPPPVQRTNSTTGAQREHPPAASSLPTTTGVQAGQQPQRPAQETAPQNYWSGSSNGYPYGAAFTPNTGQSPQTGCRAPAASYHHPTYRSPTAGANHPSTPATTTPAAPNTTVRATASSTTGSRPPTTATPGATSHRPSDAHQQPNSSHTSNSYGAPGPQQANGQHSRVRHYTFIWEPT